MATNTRNGFPKAAAGAAGALAIALGLLPLAGRTPEVAGALLTSVAFAAIPIMALVVAAFAGRSAARQGGDAGEGARTGLFVGLGVLIGTVIGFAALGVIAGNIPAVQDLIRASEPHPESRIPYGWIAPLSAATGALIGVLCGLVYLIPATLGGLLGATLGVPNRRHAITPHAH